MRGSCPWSLVFVASFSSIAFADGAPTARPDPKQAEAKSTVRQVAHTESPQHRADQSVHEAKEDTSYGRIEGDLGLALGAGVAIAPRGARGALDLRARYLDTAGLFVTYEDGPALASSAEPRRVIAAGFEIRPLFMARWLKGMEFGAGRLDLAVDSFGLEIGAFLSEPEGASFASRPGLQAGIGLELPILPHASGPWVGLHGGARWSSAALQGEPIVSAADRSLYLAITLSYHQIFGSHVVDIGDEAPR